MYSKTIEGNDLAMSSKSSNLDLLERYKLYESLCKSLFDAYVLIDLSGKPLRANFLFAHLVQKKTKEIYKLKHLKEIITFYVDEKEVTVDYLLSLSDSIRIDEVRGRIGDKDFNLILGVYPLIFDSKKLGMLLFIRDITSETKLQTQYKAKETQSLIDPLTGVYNRLYFDQNLPNILNQMVGEGEEYSLSLLMIDVDHFKNINDSRGHLAGDHILEMLGKKLKEICRKSDIVCRYGGEEFLIILPGADIHDSKNIAEKLRKAVESMEIVFGEAKIDVTISIGCTQVKIGMERAEQAIARADKALYHSKNSGRNKVSVN